MIVRVLGASAPDWSEFLADVPHDFYHLPAYLGVCAVQEGGEACALHVEDGPRSLLLPLILRPIPGSHRRDATSPYGYPGPLVRGTDDPRFVSEALAAGMGTLGSQGVVSAFVRLHPLLNPAPIEGVGELVTHGATVSIDLTLPWDEYLRQLRCNHRRDIAKAMRHGLVARTDDEFEHYRTFTSLYAETMERRSASRFYRFNDRYFDGLRRSLGERLHLIVVEEESAIVAAGLFVETSGTVQYHLGGSTGRLRTAEASKLMIHFATSWARERGNHSLHLGGGVGGSDDSLLHFKTGFSALRHPFRTLRVVIDRAEYVHLVRIHAPIAEPAALRGYFPAYRTE